MFGGRQRLSQRRGLWVLDDDTFFIKADTVLGAELKKQGSKPWALFREEGRHGAGHRLLEPAGSVPLTMAMRPPHW